MDFLTQIDGNILLWIQENLRSSILNSVMIFITSLGDVGILWILSGIVLMIPKKSRKIGIIVFIALFLSLVINNGVLKHLVDRVRPFNAIEALTTIIKEPTDSSFPSAHTASSFAAACVIFQKMDRRFGIAAIIMAALIGFSRLYLGVHYPTDVLGGALSGILISILAVKMFDQLMMRRSEKFEKS